MRIKTGVVMLTNVVRAQRYSRGNERVHGNQGGSVQAVHGRSLLHHQPSKRDYISVQDSLYTDVIVCGYVVQKQ